MKTIHDIIVGNAADMNKLADETIQLVVTSPPYPMIEMWDELFGDLNGDIREALDNSNSMQAFNLMHEELGKIWNEVDRVMEPGGFVCINIGDATRNINGIFQLYSNHSSIIKHFESLDYDVLPMIIWRKQTNKPNKFMGSGMLPKGAYVTLEHEFILIFRKPPRKVFKAGEKKYRKESTFFWEERNIWFSDIWFDLKGTHQVLHTKKSRDRSAAYPFDLPYRLINMYSMYGDTVLDPFLGTATTTKAAMLAGRNSVGYEIDEQLVNSKDGIESTFKNIIKESSKLIEKRIDNHAKFVETRIAAGKDIKYTSQNYQFPVITKQEIDMKLPIITDIKKIDTRYEVNHMFDMKSDPNSLNYYFQE